MPKTRLVIDLDEELAASLEAVAKQSQTSIESFAAKALARAVIDVEAWAEEEAAFAEYERTGEAIPIAAVEEWVRSWGTESELPPPKPCKSRADLDRLRNFLAPHGDSLSTRAVDTLFAAAYSLAEHPERGRPSARAGYRELVVPFGGRAYVIRYRVDQ
jgi:plasmid stabilization system protein ParE/predicted transcriptional regulator